MVSGLLCARHETSKLSLGSIRLYVYYAMMCTLHASEKSELPDPGLRSWLSACKQARLINRTLANGCHLVCWNGCCDFGEWQLDCHVFSNVSPGKKVKENVKKKRLRFNRLSFKLDSIASPSLEKNGLLPKVCSKPDDTERGRNRRDLHDCH